MNTVWIQHHGRSCPVEPTTMVAYRCVGGEGEVYVELARALTWGPGIGDGDYGRIIEYAVVDETIEVAL